MQNRKLIKVPPGIIISILIGTVSVFSGLIYMSSKRAIYYRVADFGTEIKPTFIKGGEPFGSGRGGVYYKLNHSVSAVSYLVENKQNYNFKYGGPLVDFDTIPYRLQLGDLRFPYTLSKEADNDTIVVEKDGHSLKFLMVNE